MNAPARNTERYRVFAEAMKSAPNAEASLALGHAATYDPDVSTRDTVELFGLHEKAWGTKASPVSYSAAMKFVESFSATVMPPEGGRWRVVVETPKGPATGRGDTALKAVADCMRARVEVLLTKVVRHG